jgi:two-component system response regulator RegX3
MPDTRTLPRIVVIEDDVVVAETLTLYLEHAGYSVTTATDGREGLALARQPGVALVILDLMIPGLSGQQVCRALRETSRVPILMLTARTSEDDRVAGLEMGADDYVPKPFSPREVVARVQALLRRAGELGAPPASAVSSASPASPAPSAGESGPARYVGSSSTSSSSSDVLRAGALEIDRWSRQVRVGGQPITLTPTEQRLLEALARHPGRTFTRDELVARAFGPDYDGLDRTIDTHITNLRRKLDPTSGAKAGAKAGASAGNRTRERDAREHGSGQRCVIVTVHGIGYKLADGEDDF